MSILGKIRISLFALAVVVGCAVSTVVQAQDLRVNLIATIDNGPAMENVKWTVYRSGTEALVTSATNHSTHVLLPAGRYKAVATLVSNNRTITRSKDFHVRTTDSSIVIPMD